MEILCFFAGIAFAYTKSIYPLILLAIAFFFRPGWSIPLWFFCALILGFSHQYWVRDRGMPDSRVLPRVQLEGSIVSIPNKNPTKTQFQFHANRLNDKPVDAKILLACFTDCPTFEAGQRWRINAKLKKPENLGNPGSFDFVSNLKARHLHWVGYIRSPALKLSDADLNQQTFLVLRERLAATMKKFLPKSPALGILQALTLNVTSNIDKGQWDLFRRTGTTHLMVISGSHIGLVAGFCYSLINWLWSRFGRVCLYCPAPKMASLLAFFSALLYALLAGFEPPSQRSIFACFFLFLSSFLSQRFTVWQAWRYGLLLVLLYEPHAVLLPGFYLSFIAVAILILINQRITGGKIKKGLCIQLACLLGLMPLSFYWFSYGAVNGLIANLVAIPWVGFFIVPFGLVNLILLQGFNLPILVAPVEFFITTLLHFLQWIDSFSMVNIDFSYTDLLAPFGLMLAMLVFLFLPIKPLIFAAGILLAAAIFPGYKRVAAGDAKIDILDVGQGLAVVIQTAKHVLVYDTGMKFYQGGDMGKLAIIPYLNTLGIHKLDKVVISHPDLDHRGGLPSLAEKYSIPELLVDKVAFYHQGQSCHQYPPWEWEGVRFRFFAIDKQFRDKNNSSCVLSVENAIGRVLLTGDIEKKAEDFLVKTYGKELKVDVLLIPHHGSKTSSSLAFIKEITPKYAVISYGFDNRYHFPHRQTIETLNQQGIDIYNTADCGMVTINLVKKNNSFEPVCFKNNHLN